MFPRDENRDLVNGNFSPNENSRSMRDGNFKISDIVLLRFPHANKSRNKQVKRIYE